MRILNFALDLENTAVAAYTTGTAAAEAARLSRWAGGSWRTSASTRRASGGRSGTSAARPTGPASTEEYRSRFPNLKSQEDVLRFAVDLENTAVEAYLDAIPRLSSPDLRQTGRGDPVQRGRAHLACCSASSTRVTRRPRCPSAFVTGVASVA